MTLVEVARAARVSKATASNVFSRPERVRGALRERVEEAARALGYAGPDPRGRMLSSGKVNAIGVVPPAAFGISLFFRNAWVQAFLSGIAEVCEERGVGLSLVSARDDQVAWGIESAIVDGLILSSAAQAAFVPPARRRKIPIVVFGSAPDGISSVRAADRAGGRAITEHLLAQGHRRFLIGGPLYEFRPPVFHPPGRDRVLVSPLVDAPDRLAGIADALSAAGLSLDAMPLVEACGTPVEEAAFGNGAELLLDHLGDATAVIALADSLALAVMDRARRRGISVPGDISVTGFDGIAEGAATDPPLTTMAQPIAGFGATAARLLLDGGESRHVVLEGELVVRGSTGVPRRR
ncbi:MAG: LacI family DNA-binding transcriptional regulator [Bauldia sp.]